MKRVMDVGLAIVLGAVVSTVAGDEGAALLVDPIAEGLLDADVGESGSGEASASELNCTAFNVTEPRICKIGGQDSGVFFPLFNGENEWSESLRGVLYFVGMIYAFAGVSLYADTFMCAIEAITSSSRTITDKDTNDQTIVKVWNPTIANLTLMALGSSAPEILLSIIEVLNKRFFAGALGPSTIVGSASFNLLVIIAICTVSVAEYKSIDRHKVFIVTAVGSIFAYVWLALMLLVITPNVVDWWEALLTILAFPILVIVAWRADVARAKELEAAAAGGGGGGNADYIVEMKDMASGGTVSSHGAKKYAGNKLESILNTMIMAQTAADGSGKEATSSTILTKKDKEVLIGELKAKTALQGQSRAVYRALGTRAIFGKSAKAFTEKTVSGTPSLQDAVVEADDPRDLPAEPPLNKATPTSNGYITFARAEVNVFESGSKTKDAVPRSAAGNCYAHLAVHRVNAGEFAETITVKYSTLAGSAVEGRDYVGVDDEFETLTFAPSETSKIIKVEIINDDSFENDEYFKVRLTDVIGEDSNDKNNPKLNHILECKVNILNDDTLKSFGDRVTALIGFNKHNFTLSAETYYGQIKEQLGLPADAGALGGIVHVIMLPWTFFNAISPPTSFMGGWPTFMYALGCVGLVTAMIGDLAGMFGCVIGLSDEITAITFVALGTSLPDTFASRMAARNEPSADAAITNVTGSNSVNVFLGLGISWMIASVYWTVLPPTDEWKCLVSVEHPEIVASYAPNGVFYVNPGGLAFSVIVFTACSVLAFVVMHIQRMSGGELGGPRRWFVAVFFVLLWITYVVLSALKSEGIIAGF